MRDAINKHKWIVIILCALVGIYFLWPIITETSDSMPQNLMIADTSPIGNDVFAAEDTDKQSLKSSKAPNSKIANGSSDSNNEQLVYITGAIQSPGVYMVPSGHSIGETIKMAGGFLPYADTESINLAEKVEDGAHVHIRFNFSGNPEALLRTQKININSATEKELDSLPGIGPAIAKRIIEYRQNKGTFTNVEDIKHVKGIGDGLFNKIKDKITV